MTERETEKLEYIKSLFAVCQTDAERRQIFFDFAEDTSYPRHVICQALKDCGINDDMSLKNPA